MAPRDSFDDSSYCSAQARGDYSAQYSTIVEYLHCVKDEPPNSLRGKWNLLHSTMTALRMFCTSELSECTKASGSSMVDGL